MNGQAASGAIITRSIQWRKEWLDTFIADEVGMVYLPAKVSYSLTQVLPVEFLSAQKITVEYQGRSYKVWVYAKRDPVENSELKGKVLQLRCELSDELVGQTLLEPYLKTSCQFD
ncbi:DUF6795 domain-containing protein [uncultured Shewanella sp.]|uniref:DUF6795 domain-containing protein n=1 Tax=uncultured Shewanella sp. TaxID=173975 RepID=UPI002626FC34|nr:DUF6795 domain-containing protein [uncultured Shewanella sp.]